MTNRPFSLIAHRGAVRHYPENTLLSLKNAIMAGAEAVEFDIQLSADQVPVLVHDADLLRVSGHQGLVMEQSFADLKPISVHEPQRFGQRPHLLLLSG